MNFSLTNYFFGKNKEFIYLLFRKVYLTNYFSRKLLIKASTLGNNINNGNLLRNNLTSNHFTIYSIT